MGGHPWLYFVPYQPDVGKALQELRDGEFAAGRYNPVTPFPQLGLGPNSAAPGAQHASILAALEAAMEDGTRSILDMAFVSTEPQYYAVCPVDEQRLVELYGSARPTREMVERDYAILEDIQRGQGAYMILFKNDVPDEILFAGYS